MLTVDLSICIFGVDQMDSAALLDGLQSDSVSQSTASAELVSQWETELLQEMLQECLHTAAEDDDDAKSQVGRTAMDVPLHLLTQSMKRHFDFP